MRFPRMREGAPQALGIKADRGARRLSYLAGRVASEPIRENGEEQVEGFGADLAFVIPAFEILVQGDGLQPDREGFVHLSGVGSRL